MKGNMTVSQTHLLQILAVRSWYMQALVSEHSYEMEYKGTGQGTIGIASY